MDRAVRGILQTEGVPPFHDNVNEVLARTLDLETTSAHMAKSVLKDLGLVSQILRLANSATYNRSGRPILSVPHAITLLGWENLRNLVTAVHYLEHYAKGSAGLKELMFLSLLTANHGREVASLVGYPRPDEAYVCSLFRNLGEVLVACHHPEEYSVIILAEFLEKLQERPAAMRVLNYSYDELGQRVADAWNLPSKVKLCLAGVPQGGPAADRCLVSVANSGHELTRAVYRQGVSSDAVRLDSLIDVYGRRARLSPADLQMIIDTAGEETSRTMAAFQIPMSRLLLENQVESAKRIADATAVFETASLRNLEASVQAASRLLINGEFELNDVIQSLLDQVARTGFDHVIFALVNEDRTWINGRLGSGESAQEFVSRFRLPLQAGSTADWERPNDQLVGRADAGTDSAIADLAPGAYCLLPIIIDGAVGGCLYADRSKPAPGIEAVRFALARTRDVIARAIRRKASRRG